MGGQICRGWIWRFRGAPIFHPEVPKPFKNRYLGSSGRKIGAPQKPICGPSEFIFLFRATARNLFSSNSSDWQPEGQTTICGFLWFGAKVFGFERKPAFLCFSVRGGGAVRYFLHLGIVEPQSCPMSGVLAWLFHWTVPPHRTYILKTSPFLEHVAPCLDVLNRGSRFAAIRIATNSQRFQITRFESQGEKPCKSLLRLYCFVTFKIRFKSRDTLAI